MYFFLIFLCFYPVKVDTVSPKKAMLYSAILPGGGQFYTRNYTKGVFLGALEVFLISSAYVNYRESLKYKVFSTEWNFYRHESVSYAIYFLGVHLFSIADAYVSANFLNVEKYFGNGKKSKKDR